jgi:hypothetical protein
MTLEDAIEMSLASLNEYGLTVSPLDNGLQRRQR